MTKTDILFRGRILTPEGQTLGGARALAFYWERDVEAAVAGKMKRVLVETHADETGVFRLGPLDLEDLGERTIWIEPANASGPGARLARHRVEDIPCLLSPEHDLGDLHLAPGCRVQGRVVRSDGTRAANARIEVVHHYHMLCHTVTQNGPAWELETDERGCFVTPALPPGSVKVTAEVPDLPRVGKGLEVLPHERLQDMGDLVLPAKPLEFAGIVRNTDGAPLAGAQVHANNDKEHVAVTGADGRFHLLAWEDPAWMISASKDGYQGYGVMPHGKDPQDFEFRLQACRILEGRVRDAKTHEAIQITDLDLCRIVRCEDGSHSAVG